jgi:hypothetical protein
MGIAALINCKMAFICSIRHESEPTNLHATSSRRTLLMLVTSEVLLLEAIALDSEGERLPR